VTLIDNVFSIEGVGTIIALPKEDQWAIDPKEEIYRRERIQIRMLSGNCFSPFMRESEMINRGRKRGSIAFGLPASIKAQDIPEGSELWLARDGAEPLIEPIAAFLIPHPRTLQTRHHFRIF